MIHIGIDPGLDGAVAILSDGKEPYIFDAPTMMVGDKREYDIPTMANIFRNVDSSALVGLELVHSMPGQGVRSMFSMGHGLGLWKGILGALQLRYTMVTPQRWKKALMDGMPKEKDAARLRAQQLFPTAELHLKKHHGRADALLIAEFIRHHGSPA